jgi:hypothetical protein
MDTTCPETARHIKKPFIEKRATLPHWRIPDMVRSLLYLVIGIAVIACCVCPAQAFTAKSLDIAVQENGDARITFGYDLSWFENAAVFARIANPATELKKALESNYGKSVDVLSTSGSGVEVIIYDFASSKMVDGSTIMKTPSLSFQSAEKVLKQYWFAPLISVDFSPEITRVIFPDGYVEQFDNQITIPSISHTLNG